MAPYSRERVLERAPDAWDYLVGGCRPNRNIEGDPNSPMVYLSGYLNEVNEMVKQGVLLRLGDTREIVGIRTKWVLLALAPVLS